MNTYLFSSLTMTQFSDRLHLEVLATEKSLILFRHHALLGGNPCLAKNLIFEWILRKHCCLSLHSVWCCKERLEAISGVVDGKMMDDL